MTYLFLDTEWANDAARALVSLALISEDGQHRFYAERNPLPAAPSSFVRQTVYPLLERGAVALPDPEFTRRLREFVESVPGLPVVLADGMLDFSMLRLALSGFGVSDGAASPEWKPELVTDRIILDRIESYFSLNTDARARRHHAMVDAEALRRAHTK
ncbi:MAG: 3'-5' exoribonuclease [Acidobacteriales bacterium]|nr:3'-5' exoribonuclease [Terriglobales bacterium]